MNSVLKLTSKNFNQILSENNISILFSSGIKSYINLLSKDGLHGISIDQYNDRGVRAIYVLQDTVFCGVKNGIQSYAVDNNTLVEKNFIPTGLLASHDIYCNNESIYYLSNEYSSIYKVNLKHKFEKNIFFTPWWIPDIEEYDACHLNGMCFVDDELRYITAFSQTSLSESWRNQSNSQGVVADVRNNEIILENLSMPHSPTFYKDLLWFISSGESLKQNNHGHGSSKLTAIDTFSKNIVHSINIEGFARAIAFYKNLAFIASSRIRNHEIYGSPQPYSSISIIDIDTMHTLGYAVFTDLIDEIFDIGIINDEK
jgi:uncharacterized protein (TIGR03032 family)